MKNKILFIFYIQFVFVSLLPAQQNNNNYSLLFYNVENLFDTKDNPLTDDDNFTPEGDLHWTHKRLNNKLLNISKVIISAGGWSSPDLVVLAEIENRYVLEKLINDTPLRSFSYKIIHKESPDSRGIDIGLIYNSEIFYPINYQYYPITLNDDTLDSREILYVSGILHEKDTIHVFGNHWPSRYSGLLETKPLRKAAASLLRNKVNELNTMFNAPKIIIVGDFNDNPDDESISKILAAKRIEENISTNQLYNLFFDFNRAEQGTLKYQSQWFLFDQIIVSGSLLKSDFGIYTTPEYAKVVKLPFLLEDDEKFGGQKPFRTYYGYTYQGGFSDHLPVLLQLKSID
jgi:hypothetical protein